jgi:hypothetical protein
MGKIRLVLLLRDNIVAAEPVCTTCLYADCQGKPRQRGDYFLCAREISRSQFGSRFRCRMGFQVAQVHD